MHLSNLQQKGCSSSRIKGCPRYRVCGHVYTSPKPVFETGAIWAYTALMMETEKLPEPSEIFNKLTRQIAQEYVIDPSRCESFICKITENNMRNI
jgi:hypothetical protein